MAKAKKTTPVKIESMQSADGENTSGDIKGPRTMYEVLGRKQHRYKTSDKGEYTLWLKTMNLADLQSHAYECGILPIDNRAQLVERLIREFCAQTSGYNVSAARRDSFESLYGDAEQMAKVKAIMARAK